MRRSELISVVIPCYRSAKYLESTVSELIDHLAAYSPFEIILVNDGSPDDVQTVIERLARADTRIRYIELGANRGQHFATLRGFEIARGSCVITVDDDGQNPPSAVIAVAEAYFAGTSDVIYGAFQTVAQSLFRRIASRANRWITKHTLGNQSELALSNVRAVHGRLARIIARSSTSTPYVDALLWRSTRRISSISIDHRSRMVGESTYTFWKLLKLWVSHLTLLTVLPLKLASVGSMFVSVASLVVGCVQLTRALWSGDTPAGWLSLFLMTSFLFSVLFLFLSIVSTYVGRIYVELNARGIDWIRSSSPPQSFDATLNEPADDTIPTNSN